MRSLEERFGDAIDELTRLDRDATTDQIERIGKIIKQLDYELRTQVNDDLQRYELTKLSDRAHALSVDAHDRVHRARTIADAAIVRERYALAHPTVLDAAPPTRNAFTGLVGNTFEHLERDRWDGFDR
ncbi:hypothetical protein [Nocardia sp. XZ_19_369]|uniref:hypothetical protein n=1 Tax=Nocardia sp. XZ_19_369 TaxID=2769487 RepID=UPI00188F8911|nr:hypothetical protein [Nocardia sp. XZ_19_369]